jgi:type 1 glutamine amidotransferase
VNNAQIVLASVLVVTATAGFRHDSIEIAEQTIASIGARTGWFTPIFAREADQMPTRFDNVDVVVFANTTGELPAASRDALLEWIRSGGTFIGIHSASDTWHESPEYIEMLGGEFEFHPDQGLETIIVNDRGHPATSTIESPHVMFEEYYRFRNFSAGNVRLLLSISPELPLAWSKSYGAGRVFYTALGHRTDVWTSEWFQQHLTGALAWALHRETPVHRRAVAH